MVVSHSEWVLVIKPGPLKEQEVLLTDEPSLQPRAQVFLTSYYSVLCPPEPLWASLNLLLRSSDLLVEIPPLLLYRVRVFLFVAFPRFIRTMKTSFLITENLLIALPGSLKVENP